jgi:hypothetical protein
MLYNFKNAILLLYNAVYFGKRSRKFLKNVDELLPDYTVP